MHISKQYNRVAPHGYITLTSLLVVGAVAVVIASSLLLLAVGASRSSFAIVQSKQANALAHACAEKALGSIRSNPPFSGNGSLALGDGTCTYTVTGSGDTRDIAATGLVGQATRKVHVVIDSMNPQPHIARWHEVADF